MEQRVREIAHHMRDPEWVQNSVLLSKSQSPLSPWSPLSLSHGYPGVVLLMACLEALYPGERWASAVHTHVVKIKDVIEAERVPNLSLFGGLTGICFAIWYASRSEMQYPKLLGTLHSYLFQKVPSVYLDPLLKTSN